MTLLATLVCLILLGAAVTAWKAARHERLAETTWPPEGRFLSIDGHRVHTHVSGQGPDLVLIHGASGNFAISPLTSLRASRRTTGSS